MGKIAESTTALPKEPELITYQYELVTWREALSSARERIIRAWRGEPTAEDKSSSFFDTFRTTPRYSDATEEADAPILGQPQKPKKILVIKGRVPRTIAGLLAICYLTFIFLGTYYLFDSIRERTTKLIQDVKILHGSLGEVYEDYKNPGSPQEVADLMLEWYELISKMGYYELEAISRPPHNPAINRTKAVENGFTEGAIKMAEMLPYIGAIPGKENEDFFAWTNYGDSEFFLHGIFVDYRNQNYFEEPRDPAGFTLEYSVDENGPTEQVKDWDEEGGRYMRPSYIELMTVGEYGAYMVLNTENYRIWTIDSEMGNADLATKDMEIKELPNRLDLNNYPSRKAGAVLRDYIQKFIDLEYMPGGLYNGSWEGDSYAALYRAHGWPSNFNRSAFMTARAEWEIFNEKLREVEEPFEKLQEMEQRLKQSLGFIEWKQKQIAEIDSGVNVGNHGEEWRAQLVLESKERSEGLAQVQADLEAAREVVRLLGPEVRKARTERIAKYGWY